MRRLAAGPPIRYSGGTTRSPARCGSDAALPDLLDEIHEDLRAERARALLRRFGGAALAGAVLLVAAVGLYQAWTWHRARQADLAAALYFEAARAAEPGTDDARRRAAALFGRVADDPSAGSWRVLARLQRAALLAADGGDGPAALGAWDKVASDPAADPVLRDAATLAWAEHGLDAGDPVAIAARLQPLAAPGNAWRGLATEALALLDLRANHPEAARARLRALAADPATPEGVRARAGILLEPGS